MKTAMLCLAVLGALGPLAQTAESADVDPRSALFEVARTRHEISLLNLLNGLYLSEEQLAQLVPLTQRAAALRKEYERAYEAEAEAYSRELTALRDALYTATGPDEETRRRTGRLHVKLDLEARHEGAEKLGELEDAARAVLTDGQIAIIADFKPCLFPPKDLADPTAVGQASTTEREEVLLDLIRRMPDALYRERRAAIANTIVRRGEREKGAVPSDVQSAMIDTYVEKLDGLRKLSPEDFELEKKGIAESFRLFDDEVTYRKGHLRQPGKIARWFLNPQGAAVLAKWQEARKSDAPELDLDVPVGVDETPADRGARMKAGLVKHYQRAARGVFRQNRATLSPRKRQALTKLLFRADEADDDDRLAALDAAVDELSPLPPTRASAYAMLAKVAYLSLQKRVPGVVQIKKRGLAARNFVDVTGLSQRVSEAHEDAENGRAAEACATLAEVADALEAFAD